MESTLSTFLRIGGGCAIAAPIVILGGDIFRALTGLDFIWTLAFWSGFVLFVPGLIGFTYVLAAAGSRLAYAGGALAVFGAIAGASMQVLFRVYAVLNEQGSTQTVDQLGQTFKLVASTQMIGITFPIGLILLAISLLIIDRTKWLHALLLTIGAVAFPIGRIGGFTAAVMISGIFLTAAFSFIGDLIMRPHKIATSPSLKGAN